MKILIFIILLLTLTSFIRSYVEYKRDMKFIKQTSDFLDQQHAINMKLLEIITLQNGK
jgi:hypothetical protein